MNVPVAGTTTGGTSTAAVVRESPMAAHDEKSKASVLG
jgi:hypothetical protein